MLIKENQRERAWLWNICCDSTCLAKHLLRQKMQIQDLTSAADSAKSVIFTAARILAGRLVSRIRKHPRAHRIHVGSPSYICIVVPACALPPLAETPRGGFDLATFTEQLMSQGSGHICRFCTLFETQLRPPLS